MCSVPRQGTPLPQMWQGANATLYERASAMCMAMPRMLVPQAQ